LTARLPLPGAPAHDLLEVTGLRKSYQGVTAVAGVSFNVPEHAIVGIIAYNFFVNKVDTFTYMIDEASFDMIQTLKVK